jgi:DNA-binding NarL/FixJ family response regulator
MMQQHPTHIKIAGEAGTFDEVLSTLTKIPADVLLLDNIMPNGNIIDVLPLIKKKCPKLKIIIFTCG